jgi:preprotein translocase subunit SecG
MNTVLIVVLLLSGLIFVGSVMLQSAKGGLGAIG